MSLVPVLAEVLGERIGRSQEEMRCLLREALAGVERRRWQSLTVEQQAELVEEVDRARLWRSGRFPRR
jgi:hypothetical protein